MTKEIKDIIDRYNIEGSKKVMTTDDFSILLYERRSMYERFGSLKINQEDILEECKQYLNYLKKFLTNARISIYFYGDVVSEFLRSYKLPKNFVSNEMMKRLRRETYEALKEVKSLEEKEENPNQEKLNLLFMGMTLINKSAEHGTNSGVTA